MLSTLSSSADFKLWNVACVCVLCVIYFLDLLTLFVATAFAIVWTGVNYYLHRRDEDSRHRLSILGLIKRDKSKHNSTPRAAYTKTVTPASATPSRSGSASYAYPRLIPGNKFDTPSRILGNSGVDNVTHGFASPVLTSKTTFLTRSCQSTFTPNHGRKSHLDWVPAATRRHPIQQEKYSVGSYPTVCLNKSPLPLAKPFASPELISPVKVKLLPLSTPVVQSSTFGPTAASNEVDKQDPCSTESVIQALKERRKRAAAAAYQDCLDPAGSSPNPVQSSKRARRESLCLALPPFTPVVTSVGGFGPPYLGSPSKNMVVRSPMPSALVSASPEGPFKRGRLASSASPPSSLAKRHRNNAIAISYCSSRSILLQRNNQSQKRKAVALDSSPASKQTKTDDRIPKGDDDESMEKNEDSSKENDAPPGAQVSAETSESDSADASMLRNRVKSLEWSPTPKKKLVYPEHMATLKEHENDQALDKERLNRLLGSLQDFSSNASGKSFV
ncbi:hypothetical protein V5799_008685 [Amblyomma americanum]|uniref:Uncharacterized protein n=1 Tax=Amblyomma americanum TaxID=6943 RepID=A0AAQ4FCS1_AMBAM